ncbi:hypothetical protein [uncultured Paludibaculum sp.]|uniref:hypothetical protein n=1 Tax=uncultured Paludibaculum sp. TaxID=1765020 RepID=UPI002AAA8346|nr:hypothetical protein [uncultured Paludibaculum sp.]
MTELELIDTLSRAIAQEEDYFKRGKMPSVSQRCNNPGNLTHWKDRAGVPYPLNNGFVQFPDEATGWRALRAQCRINVLKRKLSFLEFFAGKPGVYAGFCPRDDGRSMTRKNDPVRYARNVLTRVAGQAADAVGINTPIVALLGASDGTR